MARFSEESLHSVAERLQHEDPRLARAMSDDLLVRARRRHHRWSARATLGLTAAALAVGIALPHGLLIATGLVLAGITANLFDPLPSRARSPHLRSLR